MYRDYSNYDVLPSGRIWSKKQKKFLKPYTMKDGYQIVSLYDNNGKKHTERLHKVIYCAVNGLWNLPEGMELDHINEDKTSNQISNIRLCSHQENCNFGTRNERSAASRINHPDRSKRVGAFKDDVLVMVFPSTREAGRNGYSSGAVSKCCRGGLKTHKGYEWRYLNGEEN